MYSVYPIDILHVYDNYVWAITPHDGNRAYVVDPGEARAVRDWLQARGAELAGILITHHHWDHVTGVAELLADRQVPVWGPAQSIPEIDHTVGEGDLVSFDGITLEVMAVPGHTRDHIAYYSESNPEPALFCGDTLFASGCGRVFDSSVEDLYRSLTRLADLPLETIVYCAHEYTLTNLAFAATVEPNNPAIAQRRQQVEQARRQGRPSLPSTLALELETNPFLRNRTPSVVESASRHAHRTLAGGGDVFAALRRWKDTF